MRSVTLLLLLLALPIGAEGMPPPKRWDDWKSPKVKKRLLQTWGSLPNHTPLKMPDGTTAPAAAPWPFLLYVAAEDTKQSRKIQRNIMADTRFRLAAHACKVVVIKPPKAVDLPYLKTVPAIRDPTIIVLGRDFSVVGVLRANKDFTAAKCLALMARASDDAYEITLATYLGRYHKLLARAEKLWKEELAIDALAERGGRKDKAKRDQIYKEVEEREAALQKLEDQLFGEEAELTGSLILKPEKEEPLPTTVGQGRTRRTLRPDEIAAIKTFRQFARHQNPLVRAAAVVDLGAVDSAVIVDAILKAANDVDLRVVEAAAEALGRMKSPESLEAMHRGLLSGKERVRIAALLGFAGGRHDYLPAAPDIVALYRKGNGETRRAAIQALRAQNGADAAAALIAALGDPVPALRVLAAGELGHRREKKAAPALIELLTAKDWSLKKTAAAALGKIRVKESIEPLLRRFEVEEGLMREVLHDALVAITGQDFRYRTDNWRKWWDRHGHAFTVPTEAEIAVAKARAAKSMEGYAQPKDGRRRYHKIETLSKKIVFVLDISSSMADKIVIPADAPAAATSEFPDRVKIEIAKRELIELLATLDRAVYFNIITFAGRVKTWQPSLVLGSQRSAAIKWVSRLKPITSGGRKSSGQAQKTNTYGALMAAFGLAEKAVPNWRARTRVDTVFLVTDGVPTIGTIVEVPKLIRAVTNLNKTKGVIIHVICFDQITGRRLKPLAKQNGGKLVVRGY